MTEMSGKFKSNPTKTNNLIYIMIFFYWGVNKFSPRFARHIQNVYPPLQNPYLRPCSFPLSLQPDGVILPQVISSLLNILVCHKLRFLKFILKRMIEWLTNYVVSLVKQCFSNFLDLKNAAGTISWLTDQLIALLHFVTVITRKRWNMKYLNVFDIVINV